MQFRYQVVLSRKGGKVTVLRCLVIRFPRVEHIERKPAAITDAVTVLLGPLADGAQGVPVVATSRGATIAASATDGSVATSTRSPRAGLARSRDVTRQIVTELGGVVVRQVDLICHALEGELDCRNVLGFLAGEVVDEG